MNTRRKMSITIFNDTSKQYLEFEYTHNKSIFAYIHISQRAKQDIIDGDGKIILFLIKFIILYLISLSTEHIS